MLMGHTKRGRTILIISEAELRQPRFDGTCVRAYCHLHGGDHQRSLALHRSGWGFCFNATCPAFSANGQATVLVAEWNPDACARLGHPCSIHQQEARAGPADAAREAGTARPSASPAAWQQAELRALSWCSPTGLLEAGLHDSLAQDYLRARRVPLSLAEHVGMGYLPAREALPRMLRRRGEPRLPTGWCQRIIFPLWSYTPDGRLLQGFCGRSVQGWQVGMDEQAHKAVLEQTGILRWRKTRPAGWFGSEPEHLGAWVVLVEGPFDRCALLAAGFHPHEVTALVGTGARLTWLPHQVRTVVLALDSDAGGKAACSQLVAHLQREGRRAIVCLPPADGTGKDWSERWERSGYAGVSPLLMLRDHLQRQ